MILRKIFWKAGLKNELLFHFLAGFFFALAGIIIGRMIFSQNIGLVAVFLTSLAAISLVEKEIAISEILLGKLKRFPNKIITFEEIITVEHRVTLKSIFEDHKNLFKIYFSLFLGVMSCFMLITIVLPVEQAQSLFGEQFKIIAPNAFNAFDTFAGLLANNFMVLLTGFFLALFFELGTTFIIVWNASVWGTSFALITKTPWQFFGTDPLLSFVLLMIVFLPHIALEIVSYFSSTIAGGLLNKAIIQENISSVRFRVIATHAVVLFVFGIITLILGAGVETLVIGWLS